MMNWNADETAYWASPCSWSGWDDDEAYGYLAQAKYEEPYGQPEFAYYEENAEDDVPPTEEEADALKQESEATAMAAEASRTLSEARAAVAGVRAAFRLGKKGGASSKSSAKGSGKTVSFAERRYTSSESVPTGRPCWARADPTSPRDRLRGLLDRDIPLHQRQGEVQGQKQALWDDQGYYDVCPGELHAADRRVMHNLDDDTNPKFVLNTRATENAAGVKTLQRLLAATRSSTR